MENPANGRAADARPVDWGPHISTGRVADLSPGLAAALGLQTDDVVRITISALRAIAVKPAKGTKRPAPVSRTAPPGKPVIKQFIRSPNCSCRKVGTKIDKIVLHCTEGSLASALAEFQRSDSRKVSAHYVIDRNCDIYQMVNDAIARIIVWARTLVPSASNTSAAKPSRGDYLPFLNQRLRRGRSSENHPHSHKDQRSA